MPNIFNRKLFPFLHLQMDFGRISFVGAALLFSTALSLPAASRDGASVSAAADAAREQALLSMSRAEYYEYLRRREQDLQHSANTGGRVSLDDADGEDEAYDEDRRARRAAQYFATEGADPAVAKAEAARNAEERLRAAREEHKRLAAAAEKQYSGYLQQQHRHMKHIQKQHEKASNRHSAAAAAAAAFGGNRVPKKGAGFTPEASYGK